MKKTISVYTGIINSDMRKLWSFYLLWRATPLIIIVALSIFYILNRLGLISISHSHFLIYAVGGFFSFLSLFFGFYLNKKKKRMLIRRSYKNKNRFFDQIIWHGNRYDSVKRATQKTLVNQSASNEIFIALTKALFELGCYENSSDRFSIIKGEKIIEVEVMDAFVAMLPNEGHGFILIEPQLEQLENISKVSPAVIQRVLREAGYEDWIAKDISFDGDDDIRLYELRDSARGQGFDFSLEVDND